jgi:hypothetical protein
MNSILNTLPVVLLDNVLHPAWCSNSLCDVATVDGFAYGEHYSAGEEVIDASHGFVWTVSLRSSTDITGAPGQTTVRRTFQVADGEPVFLINEVPPLSHLVAERLEVLAQRLTLEANVTAGQTATEWERCVR